MRHPAVRWYLLAQAVLAVAFMVVPDGSWAEVSTEVDKPVPDGHDGGEQN